MRPVSAAIARNAASTRVASDPELRERLDLEHLLPHPRLVEVAEELVEVPQRDLRETRVVRGTRSTFDHAARVVGAGGREEEGDVARDVQETHRQRNLVAARVGKAAPVPAGEDVLERRLDARAEIEPAGEPLRDLAHRRERGTRTRAGVGDRVVDERGANLRRASGPDVCPVEREHLRRVRRVDEEERGPVLDVVAVEQRCLVPVRRAAGRVEKRDVVRVRELLRRGSRELAEPDREDGASQGVLERLPGAEVTCQRESPDDLGSANRPLTHRRHVSILRRPGSVRKPD